MKHSGAFHQVGNPILEGQNYSLPPSGQLKVTGGDSGSPVLMLFSLGPAFLV